MRVAARNRTVPHFSLTWQADKFIGPIDLTLTAFFAVITVNHDIGGQLTANPSDEVGSD